MKLSKFSWRNRTNLFFGHPKQRRQQSMSHCLRLLWPSQQLDRVDRHLVSHNPLDLCFVQWLMFVWNSFEQLEDRQIQFSFRYQWRFSFVGTSWTEKKRSCKIACHFKWICFVWDRNRMNSNVIKCWKWETNIGIYRQREKEMNSGIASMYTGCTFYDGRKNREWRRRKALVPLSTRCLSTRGYAHVTHTTTQNDKERKRDQQHIESRRDRFSSREK